MKYLRHLLVGAMVAASFGCTHQPPTIAHTHIGHAVTAFDGTPGEEGLFVVAERRGREAAAEVSKVLGSNSSANRNDALANLIEALVGEDYGLKRAVVESASHIEFAADSPDASENVASGADTFVVGAQAVAKRCDLVALLSQDVLRGVGAAERRILLDRIGSLVDVIQNGEDIDGSGSVGDQPEELGMAQLREQVDALVAGEVPPYVTVDRWYLFHLVRLPNCNNCWAWRKWANSSNRGY